MKHRVILGATLSFALALSAEAGAQAPSTIPIDPEALGVVDAVIQYCSNHNPSGAAGYAALRVSTFGTQSAATLLALQSTPKYKLGFKEGHVVLISAPTDSRRYCLNLVPRASTG